MAPNWKDVSSWSKSDKVRIPKTWQLDIGKQTHLYITRHIHFNPDQWIMSLSLPQLNLRELQEKDVESAKREALEKTADFLRGLLKEFEKVL